jgi:putative DNA primase/helicase
MSEKTNRQVRPSEVGAAHIETSIPSSGLPSLLDFHFNDSGNADRIIALYGKDLRYCHAFKKWLVWDGRRWAVDETDQARRLAKHTMLEFLRQAVEATNGAAEKFARSSLDARRITNTLSMAEFEIFGKPGDLDQNPYLLNFLNGTVDLRSGELLKHRRQDLITKLIHYNYRPEATCTVWQKFLDQIMGGGPDESEGALERAGRLVDYLQRALGYSLTGITVEKAVFVLFGDGDNGKSTLLATFRELVSEYAVLVQADTLMVRQESNNTQADLADLRGARFAMTSETEEGQRLAQGKLKRITQGMGKIKAVRKYENPIKFIETHKLWIDTNRRPTIRDADDKATFNRLHPIPFLVRIPKDQIDRDLPRKLLGEAEGILTWAVAGARLWCESGLNVPPEVDEAKNEWRSEVDQLGRFIDERCVKDDRLQVPASNLYSDYKLWAEEGGEKETLTATMFGRKMPDRGFAKKDTKHGIVYLGIGLRAKTVEGG